MLAVSGLDGTSQLNVLPETYSDGAGWSHNQQSPSNWPLYCHLFLLADGRVFYSGGQYGANNGVRPSIWDLATNTAADVDGVLVEAGKRNQSASVLLPPAQAQRVMLIGGGPSDMHDQTGATNTTAITDLSVANPAVAMAAPMAMRRMHLCATLLPDRTVLVNGGAMMEESARGRHARGRDLPPRRRGRSRQLGDGSELPGRPALPLGGPARCLTGRVITAGSNPARKTEELRIEVVLAAVLVRRTPAHLRPGGDGGRRTAGSLRPRVPGAAQIASACLMRPGATTHSLDAEQRLVDLPIQVTGPDAVLLQLPAAATIAPPGWYLLFVVSATGVPSVGSWIHLT